MSKRQWGHGYRKGSMDMMGLYRKLKNLTDKKYIELIRNYLPDGETANGFYFAELEDSIIICDIKSQKWGKFDIPKYTAMTMTNQPEAAKELREALGV